VRIRLQEIPHEGLRFSLADHTVDLPGKALVIEGPINGKLSIKRQGTEDLHIRGVLSTRLRLSCSRCTKEFAHSIESEFYVDYTPIAQSQTGHQEHHLYGEELHLHFYTGDTLDVGEIIENQLYLEMPMAPRCQPDCKGLCSICGEDLNSEVHVCIK
jgi:uncharacterized protein